MDLHCDGYEGHLVAYLDRHLWHGKRCRNDDTDFFDLFIPNFNDYRNVRVLVVISSSQDSMQLGVIGIVFVSGVRRIMQGPNPDYGCRVHEPETGQVNKSHFALRISLPHQITSSSTVNAV